MKLEREELTSAFACVCAKTTYVTVHMNDSLKSHPMVQLPKEEYAI